MSLPTSKDMDWMESVFTRHTDSITGCLRQLLDDGTSGKDIMRMIVTIWEAGRIGSNPTDKKES